MSTESYISYCDGQHSTCTLVQFVLMLSVNHSLAKARPTMRCIHLVYYRGDGAPVVLVRVRRTQARVRVPIHLGPMLQVWILVLRILTSRSQYATGSAYARTYV